MSGRNTHLAVLLRKTQWLLDDAAFEVGAGRYGSADRRALAESLDELALTLREYTGDTGTPDDTEDPAVVGDEAVIGDPAAVGDGASPS